MAFIQLSKAAIAAGLVGSSLMLAIPASASVLVEPGIFRRSESEAAPSTEEVLDTNSATQDIVGVASSNSEFSTLVAAVQAANIGGILSSEGPYTVFAPTDAAFNALPPGALDALLMPENRDLLVQLLYNHIAYGDVTSDQLVSGSLATFDGDVDVAVMPEGGVTVDGANVVAADVAATNGVIHAVDRVLMPMGFDTTLQARMSGSSADSSSEITRTTTLQETAIDRSVQPAPVAPTPTEAPTPAPDAPEPTVAPEPAAPEPAAAPEPQPVRGLW